MGRGLRRVEIVCAQKDTVDKAGSLILFIPQTISIWQPLL